MASARRRSNAHVPRVAERQFESIIPEVLEEITLDADYQALLESTLQHGQAALTQVETAKRQAVLRSSGIAPWAQKMKVCTYLAWYTRPGLRTLSCRSSCTVLLPVLKLHSDAACASIRRTMAHARQQYCQPFTVQAAGVSPLVRATATIFQLNIGLYCNQACTHCHVESSPKRTEMMDRSVAERCLSLLRASPSVSTLDLTGGAPELNSQFRFLVEGASTLDVEIIDRCNLTVLVEPGQEDLPEFLAKHKVCDRL